MEIQLELRGGWLACWKCRCRNSPAGPNYVDWVCLSASSLVPWRTPFNVLPPVVRCQFCGTHGHLHNKTVGKCSWWRVAWAYVSKYWWNA